MNIGSRRAEEFASLDVLFNEAEWLTFTNLQLALASAVMHRKGTPHAEVQDSAKISRIRRTVVRKLELAKREMEAQVFDQERYGGLEAGSQ